MPERALPSDSPIMEAWERFKNTEDFINARSHARFPNAVDGALWRAFLEGWMMAGGTVEAEPEPEKVAINRVPALQALDWLQEQMQLDPRRVDAIAIRDRENAFREVRDALVGVQDTDA